MAEMDNLYQIAGQLNFEYNIDDDSFYEVLDERLDNNDYAGYLVWIIRETTEDILYEFRRQGLETPQIDGIIVPEPYQEMTGLPYAAAALLHEESCEHDHSAVGNFGFVRCSSLDERETYRQYYGERYKEWEKTRKDSSDYFTELPSPHVILPHGWSIDDYIENRD